MLRILLTDSLSLVVDSNKQLLRLSILELNTKDSTLGCEFDPLRHNAIMHIDDESIADNIVVEEM